MVATTKSNKKNRNDATTSATRCANTMQMHLDALPTHLDEQQSREMSGSGVSQLKGMSRMSNGQERHPKAGHGLFIDPLKILTVMQFGGDRTLWPDSD